MNHRVRIIGITGGVGAGKTELLHYISGRCSCRIILADEASHEVMAPGGSVYEPLVQLLSGFTEDPEVAAPGEAADDGHKPVTDKELAAADRKQAADSKENAADRKEAPDSKENAADRKAAADSKEAPAVHESVAGAEQNRREGTTERRESSLSLLNPDGTINHRAMAARIFANRALLAKVNGLIHPAVRTYIMQAIGEERSAGRHDFLFIEAALLIEEGYKSVLDELWYIYCSQEVRRERLMRSRNYSEEKVRRIMQAQLSEDEFRANADVVIDNSGTVQQAHAQVDRELERLLRG